MSIIATLPVFLFSNTNALEHLLAHAPHNVSSQVYKAMWQTWVFTASHQRDSSRPEHVFEMRWKKYSENNHLDVIYALRCIADDYLFVCNGQLHVKSQDCFTRWQNLRGRISTLPIKALIAHENNVVLEPSLSYPHNQMMQDYIHTEGLNECHMHLNGYRFPEECWLDTLYNLRAYVKEIGERLKNDRSMREMFKLVNPSLTPSRQYSRLRLALYLRHFLLALGDLQTENEICELCADAYYNYKLFTINPYTSLTPLFISNDQTYMCSLHSEIRLWHHLFRKLEQYESCRPEISFLAQLYLLILNEFVQLNRHNECNKGFAPFDKACSLPRVGIGSKKYYKSVFKSILRVTKAGSKNCIEARLTPESVVKKGAKLMKWWQECCKLDKREPAPQLILVGHFIKEKAPEQPRNTPFTYPDHSKLSLKCIKQADELATFARTVAAQHKIPIGVDAANSEMNAPAEVFAPAFRHFEHNSHSPYKTFHCGEDFLHLISGIRAVSEAVHFLNLKNGNRVGHATAIGINPSLWMKSMPSYVVISRGEWLLNMLFAWNELLPSLSNELRKIERAVIQQATVIFAYSDVALDIHSLTHFYHARHLLPHMVHRRMKNSSRHSFSSFVRREMDLVMSYETEYGNSGLQILDSWHYNKKVKQRAAELIEVKTNDIPEDCLVALQQAVQRLLKQRNVIIECPLVSNLRISQYEDVEQHHLLRWLGIEKYMQDEDEKMDVCLGSDDPGIFVTDIQNEYQHLYNLLEKANVAKDDIMNIIRHVGHVSRVFSFNTPIPSAQDSFF